MNKILSLKNLVASKMDNNYNATINYTGKKVLNYGRNFNFHYDIDEDSWTVYQGCELIVGDTSFDMCAKCVLNEIS